MNPHASRSASLILGGISVLSVFAGAQNKQAPNSSAPPAGAVDYHKDEGVFIKIQGWTEIEQICPSRTHLKRAIAPSVTYGAIPAATVTEYDGPHADVQLSPGRPILCILHESRIPTTVLVRLHGKKTFRELNGGSLRLPGSKIHEAASKDLVEVDVSQPEDNVWLINPREVLPTGEYALMLGRQNVCVFPFTVSNAASNAPAASHDKP